MALTAEQIRELMAQAGNPNYDLNPGFGALTNKTPVIRPRSDLSMTPGFQGEMGGFTPPIPGGGTPLGGGAMQGGFGMGGGGFDPMAMQGGMGMTPDVGGREGLQYDFGIDGQQQSFGFDNALTPQGVDAFRLNQGLTPEPRLAEDRMMLPPFARPPAVFDPFTKQNRVGTFENPANADQQPPRYGPGFGARNTYEYWPEGEKIPPTISSIFAGPF